ncbi:S8 family serine peptidase [Candidatus Synechococcus spongiarum]|uniref:S8 family serine peptidase n=1 Tax=Candidatus Synechococcus spongiarum TaxID=431041 RepID=UPI0013775171|nr:S8 family serine peptidase [Candidatus Synechococcus spongiarum]
MAVAVYVLHQDPDILNLSFGYSGGIENYSGQELRSSYSRTIAALAQADRQEKTILVWATGNAGDEVNANSSSPEIYPGLAARAEELQGHSIAVVSTRAVPPPAFDALKPQRPPTGRDGSP